MQIPGFNYVLHVLKACRYAWQGLCFAWRDEKAFRIEVVCFVPLLLMVPWLTSSGLERAALIAVLLFVIIIELLNSGIEAAIDRIGLEQHPLSGKAKDVASAAVGLAVVIAALVWAAILL